MKRRPQEPAALEKRAQPGRFRAVILAVVVHALFFGLIVFGVSWQSSPTPPVEAELWDKLPPAQAKTPPRQEPPKPEPPEPDPPKPVPPKPEPPKPEPPKPKAEVKPEPPKPDPEIALKAEREKREAEKKKQDELRKKRELEEAAKKKREQEEASRKKREQEELARKKREEEAARQEAEKARAVAQDARQKEFDRFVAAIRNKIRGRANVPDTVTGRPSVRVQIRILPGGDVLDIRILKSSGNPAYDSAIERAIRSAQPLPVPAADSELFPQFRDLILNIEHER